MEHLKVGCRVTHKFFPPVEGIVAGGHVEWNLDGSSKLMVHVIRDDDTIYSDYHDTWDLVETGATQYTTKTEQRDDLDIIDAEFTVVE